MNVIFLFVLFLAVSSSCASSIIQKLENVSKAMRLTDECNECTLSNGRLKCYYTCFNDKPRIEVRSVDNCMFKLSYREDCNICKCIFPGDLMVCTASICETQRQLTYDGSRRPEGRKVGETESQDSWQETNFVTILFDKFFIAFDVPGWRNTLKLVICSNRRISRPNSETTSSSTTTATPDITQTTDSTIVEESTLRNVKPEELDSEDFECTPNLPFKVECNTCWCSSSGREPRLCTRIACNPKVYPPLDQQ